MPEWLNIRMNLNSTAELPSACLAPGYEMITAAEWGFPECLGAWLDILARSFSESLDHSGWTEAGWREQIVDRPQFDPAGVFLVRHEGRAVATAFAWLDTPEEREWGRVHWVATDPAHRGKGLGRAVTLAVARYFADRGFPRVFLETQAYRIPAIRVYVKLGFVPFWDNEAHRAQWEHALPSIADLLAERGWTAPE